MKYRDGNNYSNNTRRSVSSNNSVHSDRIVDYQKNKNTRLKNLSLHEQFNLDIMNNLPSWGSAMGSSSKAKTSNTKFPVKMDKKSLLDEILRNKSRAINQKQRLYQVKLSNNSGLPPPPLGHSMGHGILGNKSGNRSVTRQTFNVSVLSNE